MKKKKIGLAVICLVSILAIGVGFVVATQQPSESHYATYTPDNGENGRWWPVPESLGLRPFDSDRTVSISLPISISLGADGTSITSRDEPTEQLGLYAEIGPEHQDMSFGELVLWFTSNSGVELINSLEEQEAPQWFIDAFREILN